MTDHDSFLRTIIENPADDGPRLVYADWLEERGDPRGEFIRVQCELAGANERCRAGPPDYCYPYESLGKCGPCLEALQLRRRERELLDRYRLSWLWTNEKSLPRKTQCGNRGFDMPGCLVTFRRGFVEEIALSFPDWVNHADAIRAATPLRKVRLTTMPPSPLARGHLHFDRKATLSIISKRWRGIEFELPPERVWDGATAPASTSI